MKPPDPRENAGTGGRRQATVMESVEEIRALARRTATGREAVPPTAPMTAGASCPEAAEPFRPVERPSMALLTVIDDGDDSGESIRIRTPTFVIGRVEGDLAIPHDGGISGRHAEISRRHEGGHSRWYLRDLQSTNGTFVRAASVILHPDQEVLIGRGRWVLENARSVNGLWVRVQEISIDRGGLFQCGEQRFLIKVL